MVSGILRIRNFEETDTKNILDFLTKYSPFTRTWGLELVQAESYFRWKFFRSPFGISHLAVACDDGGQILGFMGLVKWKLSFGENEVSCAKGSDMLTHPNHYGRGVATALASYLNNEAQRAGIQLRISRCDTPVQSEILQKAGMRLVKNCLVYHAKVHHYFPVLAAPVKSKLRKTSRANPEFLHEPSMPVRTLVSHTGFGDLLRRDRQYYDPRCLATPRTVDYVNWRYGEHPTVTYHTAAVELDGSLAAAAIFRPICNRGVKMIELRELFFNGEEAASALLEDLLKATGADCISGAWSLGSPKVRILRKLGFRRTFGRIHLLVKILNTTSMGTPFEAEGWDVAASEFTWN